MIAFGRKILAFSSLLAFLAVVLNIILFINLAQLAKKKENANYQLKSLEVERKALDVLYEKLRSKPQGMDEIELTLPKTLDEFVTFSNDLSAIATASGMKLEIANDKQPKQQKQNTLVYKTQSLTFEVSGSYRDLLVFFERMASLPYFFHLNTFTVTKNKNANEVNISGKLILYIR
ncbi:type 4a pilus biogenesis protein PilO [Candidatus Curtissbacteria bacterium]|nr:type 4a pilus biogenesis protein PilO [Candidatus Curtissbacteria bacterium]